MMVLSGSPMFMWRSFFAGALVGTGAYTWLLKLSIAKKCWKMNRGGGLHATA
jgi:hypothetical protein